MAVASVRSSVSGQRSEAAESATLVATVIGDRSARSTGEPEVDVEVSRFAVVRERLRRHPLASWPVI
jgi:hypothetical protein